MSVEGPSKADIQCSDNPDGTLKVGYKPTEPGSYTLNVRSFSIIIIFFSTFLL